MKIDLTLKDIDVHAIDYIIALIERDLKQNPAAGRSLFSEVNKFRYKIADSVYLARVNNARPDSEETEVIDVVQI